MKRLCLLPLLLAAAPAEPPKPAPSPNEIVAAALASDWVAIDPGDTLVMELAPDAKGRPRKVIIQLMPPPFSQGWIGNIRKLAAAHWWDGLSINRVQDNYVVQWGDANADDSAAISKDEFEKIVAQRVKHYRQSHPRARAREIDQATRGFRQAVMNENLEKALSSKAKPMPVGLVAPPEVDYALPIEVRMVSDELVTGYYAFPAITVFPILPRSAFPSILVAGRPYAPIEGFSEGWPVGVSGEVMFGAIGNRKESTWPIHCYSMVGVGRNLSPDTGSGAELYTVIGHAPRHLDRNIALVGRVIEGIEHLSSLPRGTEALGFYKTPEERVPIKSIRLATELSTNDIPRFEYLSTESDSFARYADARANRRDAFFIKPAGGADICNIPVPVRRTK